MRTQCTTHIYDHCRREVKACPWSTEGLTATYFCLCHHLYLCDSDCLQKGVPMRRHFRKGPTLAVVPPLYDMPIAQIHRSFRPQYIRINFLNLSLPPFFTHLPPLGCLRGDMMNMQMSDRSSCIGPMSCLPPLLRPTHIFQSNLSPSLALVLSCFFERSFPELSQ